MLAAAGWHEICGWQLGPEAKAALFHPTGTSFSNDQVVRVVEPSRMQGFEPWQYYTVDETVGRTDNCSMRIAEGERPETRTVKTREGLSPFGRDYDGREMTVELYVKTKDLAGTFRVEVTGFAASGVDGVKWDRPARQSSKALTGTSDGWQRIRLKVAPKPSDPVVFISLILDGKGGDKGTVWIDDVSFMPSP